MNHSATAVWRGSLNEGIGRLTTPTGLSPDSAYSYRSRFEGAPGTNPEELIAAAHVGCFALALTDVLSEAGFPSESIKVTADVTLENVLIKGWTFTGSTLVLVGRVPEIAHEKYIQPAATKANGPVSRVLNLNISLDASLL